MFTRICVIKTSSGGFGTLAVWWDGGLGLGGVASRVSDPTLLFILLNKTWIPLPACGVTAATVAEGKDTTNSEQGSSLLHWLMQGSSPACVYPQCPAFCGPALGWLERETRSEFCRFDRNTTRQRRKAAFLCSELHRLLYLHTSPRSDYADVDAEYSGVK